MSLRLKSGTDDNILQTLRCRGDFELEPFGIHSQLKAKHAYLDPETGVEVVLEKDQG